MDCKQCRKTLTFLSIYIRYVVMNWVRLFPFAMMHGVPRDFESFILEKWQFQKSLKSSQWDLKPKHVRTIFRYHMDMIEKIFNGCYGLKYRILKLLTWLLNQLTFLCHAWVGWLSITMIIEFYWKDHQLLFQFRIQS